MSMKKRIIASLIIGSVFAGSATFASALSMNELQTQIQALMGRIQELTAQLNILRSEGEVSGSSVSTAPAQIGHRICMLLNRNLGVGAQGDDVRGLQEFLSEQGHLRASPTGYFGQMTAEAVRRWQAQEGVQAVGAFGPLSRDRLRMWCGGNWNNEQRFSASPARGTPPLTVVFSTWLSGFRGSSVSYVIDFGDATSERAADCYAPADACERPGENTHTYTQYGVYTATLIEQTDPCGNNPLCAAPVQSRIVGKTQIVVSEGGASCTKEYKPVCGSKQVYCITTPCNPVEQTYANECLMKADGAVFQYEGQCQNFSDPSLDRRCRAWYDGCNNCARETPDGAAVCTLRACVTREPARCTGYFDSSSNRAPSISGFSGPTTLAVNQTGTWTVQATDPENGTLSYSVSWGDELLSASGVSSSAERAFTQTTSFTHAYARAGTFTISIAVRDSAGNTAKTTTTVRVTGGDTACTMDYRPVCGQPPEPACRRAVPACMMATPGPQTYGNRCQLNAAGATYLYDGECRAQTACTADAMACPDGSYVGRTGPNCQFVCPTTMTMSCTTPWGNVVVQHGSTISSQPYFTNGQFTHSVMVPLMRCQNGSWLRCDTQGNSCVPN